MRVLVSLALNSLYAKKSKKGKKANWVGRKVYCESAFDVMSSSVARNDMDGLGLAVQRWGAIWDWPGD